MSPVPCGVETRVSLYRLELELPGILPATKNKGFRQSRRQRINENRTVRDYVAIVVKNQRPDTPLQRASLTVIRCSAASKEPDFEALVAGGASIIDGLVQGGVLSDDNPEVIVGNREYLWEKAPRGKGGYRIVVEEVLM